MLTTRTVTVTGSQEDRNQFLIMLTDVNQECEVFRMSEMGLQRFKKQTFSEYFDLKYNMREEFAQ